MSIHVACNAWTGREKVAGDVANAARWSLRRKIESAPRLLAPRKVDLRNWRDPDVGWGVVLADGVPIPAPLQQLISERNAPIFRYIPNWEYQFILLRNYEAGKDIDINAAPRGTAPDALPYYLLIHGTPQQVPWRLQYVLNANRAVGRLHLTGRPLENYINAVRTGSWAGTDTNASSMLPNRALLWAVDHGGDDITTLMRNAIAAPLMEDLREDDQIGAGARFIDGQQGGATASELVKNLEQDRPGLIVTTSHGMTGPLDNKEMMARDLGLLVDADNNLLTEQSLLSKWQPGGAIWYAHACCSAGSDDVSAFVDLFDGTSPVRKVLEAVAGLGARVAPLPTALLGAERPLRAFIGHVEPTFDWTLKQPATGQFVTSSIVEALYGNLYVRKGDIERPIGFAFREWYGRTNGLRSQLDQAIHQFNRGENATGILLALQLAARDVESTVILGDPAVAMPGLD